MTSLDLELVRTAAELILAIGLPLLGRWAVKKNLIQQRWEVVIEAAAAAGLNAGKVAGPIGSKAFYTAGAAAILGYAKDQAPDVLVSKSMTDEATVQAGFARMSNITEGAVGPAGSLMATQPVADL
jgi:hypothetical protein